MKTRALNAGDGIKYGVFLALLRNYARRRGVQLAELEESVINTELLRLAEIASGISKPTGPAFAVAPVKSMLQTWSEYVLPASPDKSRCNYCEQALTGPSKWRDGVPLCDACATCHQESRHPATQTPLRFRPDDVPRFRPEGQVMRGLSFAQAADDAYVAQSVHESRAPWPAAYPGASDLMEAPANGTESFSYDSVARVRVMPREATQLRSREAIDAPSAAADGRAEFARLHLRGEAASVLEADDDVFTGVQHEARQTVIAVNAPASHFVGPSDRAAAPVSAVIDGVRVQGDPKDARSVLHMAADVRAPPDGRTSILAMGGRAAVVRPSPPASADLSGGWPYPLECEYRELVTAATACEIIVSILDGDARSRMYTLGASFASRFVHRCWPLLLHACGDVPIHDFVRLLLARQVGSDLAWNAVTVSARSLLRVASERPLPASTASVVPAALVTQVAAAKKSLVTRSACPERMPRMLSKGLALGVLGPADSICGYSYPTAWNPSSDHVVAAYLCNAPDLRAFASAQATAAWMSVYDWEGDARPKDKEAQLRVSLPSARFDSVWQFLKRVPSQLTGTLFLDAVQRMRIMFTALFGPECAVVVGLRKAHERRVFDDWITYFEAMFPTAARTSTFTDDQEAAIATACATRFQTAYDSWWRAVKSQLTASYHESMGAPAYFGDADGDAVHCVSVRFQEGVAPYSLCDSFLNPMYAVPLSLAASSAVHVSAKSRPSSKAVGSPATDAGTPASTKAQLCELNSGSAVPTWLAEAVRMPGADLAAWRAAFPRVTSVRLTASSGVLRSICHATLRAGLKACLVPGCQFAHVAVIEGVAVLGQPMPSVMAAKPTA